MSDSSSLEQQLLEYKAILEDSETAVIFTRARRIYRCSRHAEEIFGWPTGSLENQPSNVFFPDNEAYRMLRQKAGPILASGKTLAIDIPLLRHDRSGFVAHVSARAIDPDNPRSGTLWVIRDISSRRATEKALRQSNREYEQIFENAMIGISYMRGRTFLRCNHRLEEIFGLPPGSLAGKSSRLLFACDEDWEETGRRVYAPGAGKQGFVGEIRYRHQNGTPIWVRASGQPIQNGDEGIWVWTHQDVTRRHLAEEALRKSHDELEQRVVERTAELSLQLDFVRQLIEAIPGPVFYKDAQLRYLGCNRAFEDFIGIKAKDLIGRMPHDISPPGLAEKYVVADQQLLDQPGSQIYESRVRYADGEIREVVFHKATFAQPDGSIGGLIGVMLDITERKRMEESLQQAATVFDSSAEGITITAPDGSIIAVNRAFTEITGYAREEVIGHNSRMLQSGRHDQSFYREIWNSIIRTGRWQGEIWNRHKDGHIYPEWLTISAVKDGNGKPRHYVGVFSDITAIKNAHEQLDYQAHHDPLTGLPNRLLLEDRLHVALQHARREQSGLAILFVDLDRFKNINDSLGHHIGDRVLCEVAWRIGRLMRESDTIARLGGDEFLIVLDGTREPAAAASHIADKILEDLRESPIGSEQEFFIGASIGISLFPQDGDDSATLIKHADVAMYRAKERGRNTYEFFTADLTRFPLERFRMEASLRRAIERDELRVYLQPQFSLRTGELTGAEALVRWQHPELGLVLPGKFIPLAEESGLIVPIGEWVLETVCRHWAAWATAGLKPGVVSVNISGIEFRRGRIQDSVRKALGNSRLPAELLELEITESAIMSHADSSIQVLRNLRTMGLNLTIDDFGTGYSSLAYLKRLPLNKLKVDQSFVRGLPGSAEDCAITRAVIALAHSLQLQVIAEGVETEMQRVFLAREGCDEMQGYLRGKPMPINEFARNFLAGSTPGFPSHTTGQWFEI